MYMVCVSVHLQFCVVDTNGYANCGCIYRSNIIDSDVRMLSAWTSATSAKSGEKLLRHTCCCDERIEY
jgi:hypothetical protein